MQLLLVPLFAALLLGSGCARQASMQPTTYTEAAEQAFAEGERLLARRDYEAARRQFRTVYQNYPYSRFAALSELRIADSFYRERSWARAIEQYRRFVRFHPTHERVEEASFQIAHAYVQQMPGDPFLMPPSHERDLGSAEEAFRALQNVLREYPDSAMAGEARAHLDAVRERLAAHELYVIRFYQRRDESRAVIQRASALVERFPESARVPDALFHASRALLQEDEVDRAVATLRRLVSEYPDSEAAREARPFLERYGLLP